MPGTNTIGTTICSGPNSPKHFTRGTPHYREEEKEISLGDLLLDPKCWDETVTTAASAASGTGVKPNQNRKKTKKAGTELMDEWDSDTMEWTPRS